MSGLFVFRGDRVSESRELRQILICENYPGLREAFKLMFEKPEGGGPHYGLTFVEHSSQIVPLLAQHAFRLLIWDLDRATDSPEGTFKGIRAGHLPELSLQSREIVATLDTIHTQYPTLKILLIAGDFEPDFQIAAFQHSAASFLTKSCKRPAEVVEKVQVLLGDKKSSIRSWILKVPFTNSGGSP